MTDREKDVSHPTAAGSTNAEIAERPFLTEVTAKTHATGPSVSVLARGTDLWRSAVGAWWVVDRFPRVPRGSLHDLAQVWHGLLRPEATAEGRTEGKASHLGL
ncbi:hypothetical protein [Streptomyces mirabilis]|uniref:hypothetical protein n=1 Tax=Streptomyces mirabilis TaxID=68239 RepID=UPI003690002D